jgi:sulfite reductase (NADPH) flavoprotein alpha-component
MMPPSFVPLIPETAPFTAEQRAYLNGFLAGLFSRSPVDAAATVPDPSPQKPLQPLTILFGSQTGNAEALAKRVAKEASKQGFAPTVFDLAQYPPSNLASEQQLLLITSTYGDGDPPDSAKAFWEFLASDQAPALPQLRFSILALGDTNYEKFCACGKNFDARLEALGAIRIHARMDCDVDFEEPAQKWLQGVLPALATSGGSTPLSVSTVYSTLTASESSGSTVSEIEGGSELPRPGTSSASRYNRRHPFPASLLANRPLNGAGSSKDTRHCELALEGSDLTYEVGDALGVMPTNCPELVTELLTVLNCHGDEPVPGPEGMELPMREALLRYYEITKVPPAFLHAVAAKSNDTRLQKLAAPGVNGELTRFLWGRDIIDLLQAHPHVRFTPSAFVSLLKTLQPRLYSISSSPKAHLGQVHLTVGVLRYHHLDRARKGVCSTFLGERVPMGTPVPVFVQPNKSFRPPSDPKRPAIMVGPGTGVAPFRAFLEERRSLGAPGHNWLFFGDQRAQTDFLYRDELETMLHEGTLTRLDTAFSRDQAEKVYVQQRMLENARPLFDWLEKGASFYVCGDASRMAKDVDKALHQVIETGGGRTPDQAADYVRRLQAEKRYQRDVY